MLTEKVIFFLCELRLPLRPAHSISKLNILNGATSAHSPSGAWEMRSFQAMSTSIWHLMASVTNSKQVNNFKSIVCNRNRYLETTLTSEWGRIRHLPAGNSIQLQPTMSESTMYLGQSSNQYSVPIDLNRSIPDFKINVGLVSLIAVIVERRCNLSPFQKTFGSSNKARKSHRYLPNSQL